MSRVRIRFCKQADLRLISHRDLARTMERLFRRAGIEVSQSEGFHPKPRMMFPSALALGMVGLDEVMEVDLVESPATDELLRVLNAEAPPGLSFHAAEVAPPGVKKAQAQSLIFETPVPAEKLGEVRRRVAELLAVTSYPIRRADGHEGQPGAEVDLRPLVEALEVEGDVLRMKLRVVHEAGARPREVLEAVGLAADRLQGLPITRTGVELRA